MSGPLDVLFIAYANHMTAPLQTLKDEYDGVKDALSPRKDKQHFNLVEEPFLDNETLSATLSKYREQIVLFSYSGHAEQDGLIFDGEQAFVQGIAHLLGQCPNLKCALLNGCSSQGQVGLLLEAGVPAVIATSAPVEDSIAADFGVAFFQALANQETIAQAFEQAKGTTIQKKPDLEIPIQKDFVFDREGNTDVTAASWGLFINPGKESVLDYTIPNPEFVAPVSEFEPNKVLIDTLVKALASADPAMLALNTIETYDKNEFPFETRRKLILNSLPFPLKDHLRQLFATPHGGLSRGTIFFDKLDQARLDKLLVTYDTLIELTAFIMLTQLWKKLPQDKKADKSLNGIPKPEILKKYFLLKEEGEEIDFMQIIQESFQILQEYPDTFFIDEIDGKYMSTIPQETSTWGALDETLMTLGTDLYDFLLDNPDEQDSEESPIKKLGSFLEKQEEYFFDGYNDLLDVRDKIRQSLQASKSDLSPKDLEADVQSQFLESGDRESSLDRLRTRMTEYVKIMNSSLDDDEVEERVDALHAFFTGMLEFQDKRKNLISSQLLTESSELLEANKKLAELRKVNLEQKQNKVKLDEATLAFKCQEVEEQLAILLRNFSFLANYKLVSITDINVLKYRHSKEADYQHKLAKLDRSESSNIEEHFSRNIAMDCESVILISRRKENEFLNLSPFVIDEHAFIKKATEAKIRFFSRFGDDKYLYKYFSKPEDEFLQVESKTNHYRILKNQFKPYLYFTKA